MNSFKCPECKQEFGTKMPDDWNESSSATCDCPECDALLLIEGYQVYEFHKRLHEEEPLWPVDGKDTAYVEV